MHHHVNFYTNDGDLDVNYYTIRPDDPDLQGLTVGGKTYRHAVEGFLAQIDMGDKHPRFHVFERETVEHGGERITYFDVSCEFPDDPRMLHPWGNLALTHPEGATR